MRSDRKKQEKKERKGKKLYKILSIIYVILAMVFLGLMFALNVLPFLYLLVLVILLGMVTLFTIPALYSPYGKAERQKKARVIAAVMIVVFLVGDYYLASTLSFLNGISGYVVGAENDRKEQHVNVTKESFNVLVSGIDTTGDIETVSRSDVNMVVTVNPKTRKILMTSIPRDYYVELPSKSSMDKLTHTGIYGAEETIGAVENLLGIDINYYTKVNYTTITGLVDAIGGIDIVSPYEFDTHGMGVYYHFDEGPAHLDGSHALAYCRERKSWVDGDMRRNENQQLILEAILKKATKGPTILLHYTGILDAVKGTVETDMEKGDMTDLVRMQLGNMSSWDIQKQAIKGSGSNQYCYSLGTTASVVLKDEDSVAAAIDLIESAME